MNLVRRWEPLKGMLAGPSFEQGFVSLLESWTQLFQEVNKRMSYIRILYRHGVKFIVSHSKICKRAQMSKQRRDFQCCINIGYLLANKESSRTGGNVTPLPFNGVHNKV